MDEFSAIQSGYATSIVFSPLNNVVEQDHRFVKRRVNPGLGFGAIDTARRTIQGYEAMHMFRKGQHDGLAKGDILAQNRVINQLFGLTA